MDGSGCDPPGRLEGRLRAAEYCPSFATAWNNKGEALYAMGRYDEAIQSCDRAIRLDPISANIWYIKALIFKKEAHAAFARAEELA
jgi:tetratricopeptide (TPR) repeat protein